MAAPSGLPFKEAIVSVEPGAAHGSVTAITEANEVVTKDLIP